MAIYHFHVGIVSRGSSRGAVAQAAYNAGEAIDNERLCKTFDYTDKEEVIYSDVMLPEYAPPEFADRATLWNAVEMKEHAPKARFARKYDMAIPMECTKEQAIDIFNDIGRFFTDRGMAFDGGIHWNTGNPHIHAMTTMRMFNDDGTWGPLEHKVFRLDDDGNRIPRLDPDTGGQMLGAGNRKQWIRDTVPATNWSSKEFLLEARQAWQDICNERLIPMGIDPIDCRSLAEQGIDREPTIHIGQVAGYIRDRGEPSDRVEFNEAIIEHNSKVEALRVELEDTGKEMLDLIEVQMLFNDIAIEDIKFREVELDERLITANDRFADEAESDAEACLDCRQETEHLSGDDFEIDNGKRDFIERFEEESDAVIRDDRDEHDFVEREREHEDHID